MQSSISTLAPRASLQSVEAERASHKNTSKAKGSFKASAVGTDGIASKACPVQVPVQAAVQQPGATSLAVSCPPTLNFAGVQSCPCPSDLTMLLGDQHVTRTQTHTVIPVHAEFQPQHVHIQPGCIVAEGSDCVTIQPEVVLPAPMINVGAVRLVDNRGGVNCSQMDLVAVAPACAPIEAPIQAPVQAPVQAPAQEPLQHAALVEVPAAPAIVAAPVVAAGSI